MTYWRRRFLALLAGLTILALVAWAFSGVVGASGGSLAPSPGHRSPGHRSHAGGAAASAGGTSDCGGAAKVSPLSAGASSPASAAPGCPSPEPTQAGASAPPGPVRACNPGDVVLSLFSSQASYGAGQLPEFDVDVVSTSAGTCAFNVGPRFLVLVITAAGKRVWSSADCVAGQGSLQTDLARGVPTVLPLTWDRESSAPGCKATSRQVAAPSLAAAASDAGLVSNSLTFKLS